MDKEELKAKLLNGYCYFIPNEQIKTYWKDKINNQIGLFMEVDWYLDQNQLFYLDFELKDEKYNENKKENKLVFDKVIYFII